MATISASWTEDQSLVLYGTVTAGNSSETDLDIATNGYDVVVLQWTGSWGVDMDAGMTFEVLASADSGTTNDTVPIFKVEVPKDTIAFSVVVCRFPHIRVKRTNNATPGPGDGDITSETIKYAGRKFTNV
jgi:hypothetical protein